MLVLSRKTNEEILIGENIRITVVSIQGNQVRLGFTAPGDVTIYRSELIEPVEAAAASSSTTPKRDDYRSRSRLVRR